MIVNLEAPVRKRDGNPQNCLKNNSQEKKPSQPHKIFRFVVNTTMIHRFHDCLNYVPKKDMLKS